MTSIAFVGDVMLGRGVDEEIPYKSPQEFWGTTLPIFQNVDAAIANLECAITEHKQIWQAYPKAFYFRARPQAIEILKVANITCVSLANNHILDFEEEGLFDTLKYLNKAGIYHAGAGNNKKEAITPAIFEVSDLRIGFLSITDNEPGFAANMHAGTNYMKISTDQKTIAKLKEQIDLAYSHNIDLLILSLHWGPNMVISPPKDFRDFAHEAIRLGVDIIHGHSAHVFQGIEIINGHLIMYDTGDFIDDYAVDPLLRNDWSFIFIVNLGNKDIESIDLIPVRLNYARVDIAKGREADDICDRMIKLCKEFGTFVVKTSKGLKIKLKESDKQAKGVT